MDIITRAEAGLPPISGVSRRTEPWAGITVHHTGGAYTTWKAIHDWQTSGRPEDQQLVYIGYSYGIANGRVTELRGWDYRPAGDHENSRIQLCLMGTYDSKLPTAADLQALRDFVAYARARAKAELPIVTHRQVWPSGHQYATDCPGDALHAWVRDRLLTPEDDMLKDETLKLPLAEGNTQTQTDAATAVAWGLVRGTATLATVKRLEAGQAEIRANLAALAGKDWVDEQAVVDGVLAGLAAQSADEIAERLAVLLGPELGAQVVAALGAKLVAPTVES